VRCFIYLFYITSIYPEMPKAAAAVFGRITHRNTLYHRPEDWFVAW
jgi:hypothetical protein